MANEKYRGKSLDGKWVHGYLLAENYIGTYNPKKPQIVEVKPESTGQKTGVLAGNGIVYEGDIVSYKQDIDGKPHQSFERVVFENGAFRAGEGGYVLSECGNLTIEGNIIDNPTMEYGVTIILEEICTLK